MFGGFTQQSWDGKTGWKKDEKAFIYSIDRKQIYRVVNAEKAIFCHSPCGPCFGWEALGLGGDALNNGNAGSCYTNEFDDGYIYGIKSDAQGNNEVTREGN